MRNWILIGLLASVMPVLVFAEFITERLEIPVRSGDSRDYRIVRYLTAGTEVTILETTESGYIKIKDEREREGYVLARYIVKESPSFLKIGRLEAEIVRKTENVKRLEQTIRDLTEKIEVQKIDLDKANELTANKQNELNQLIATSGETITLQNRLVSLETERQILLSDNERLRAEKLAEGDDSAKTWFALGAATLAFGWLIGLLVPRVRKTRIDTTL